MFITPKIVTDRVATRKYISRLRHTMKLNNELTLSNSLRFTACAVFTIALASCGGGGGSPGNTGGTGTSAGTPTGSGTGTGTTPGTGTAPTASPSLTLSLADSSGAATNTLSGGQKGIVRATFRDGSGAVLANAIVKYTASDNTLVQFSPVSASALTDASGVAVISVQPKDFASDGALTITADAILGLKAGTNSVNIKVGAASLTVGTLSLAPAPASSLPAFSTVTLNVPVTSNGQPVSTAPGLVLTSLCQGDHTATLLPGAVSNGVLSATYTNLGCTRLTDTITAAIGSSIQTISVGVDTANIGTIRFTGSDISGSSLVLKGSGGLDRKESALVTFKVVDLTNVGLAGVVVNFKATTTTGGLTVLPASATTDINGNVSTTVASGGIPTPVKVIAEATQNGKTISGLSDALTVSTGLPIQKAMSLSVDKYNIEGLDYDGEITNITLRMADQYGNPISDGTTINFVTEGGAVGFSSQGACNTVNGSCTVPLVSQAFRPANGRVTVLAYAQGIEDFVDSNGDGQYSCTDFTAATSTNGAPLIYRPLVDSCNSGGEPFLAGDMGDPFLDAGSLAPTTGVATNGTWDGQYQSANGDLPFPFNSASFNAAGNGKWGINYIRRSAEIVFSGSSAILIRQDCSSGNCVDWTGPNPQTIQGVAGTGCSSQVLTFRLVDVNNNPLPAGTAVSAADADKLTPQTLYPDKVLSSNSVGGTLHSISIKPEAACAAGSFTIKTATPKGNGSAFFFKSN